MASQYLVVCPLLFLYSTLSHFPSWIALKMALQTLVNGFTSLVGASFFYHGWSMANCQLFPILHAIIPAIQNELIRQWSSKMCRSHCPKSLFSMVSPRYPTRIQKPAKPVPKSLRRLLYSFLICTQLAKTAFQRYLALYIRGLQRSVALGFSWIIIVHACHFIRPSHIVIGAIS